MGVPRVGAFLRFPTPSRENRREYPVVFKEVRNLSHGTMASPVKIRAMIRSVQEEPWKALSHLGAAIESIAKTHEDHRRRPRNSGRISAGLGEAVGRRAAMV